MTVRPPATWPRETALLARAALASGRLSDVRAAAAAIRDLPSPLRGRPFRLGIVRTYTIDTTLEHLELALACLPVVPEITVADLDNIEQELVVASSPLLAAAPDAILVLWRLEDNDPRLAWEADLLSPDERAAAGQALIERLDRLLRGYAGRAPLFVSTLPLPVLWQTAPHDRHRPSGVAELLARFNAHACQLAGRGAVGIFDVAAWQATAGPDAYDQRMELFARQPLSLAGSAAFAAAAARLLAPLVMPRAKVLAVDLDDTLWGGVVGEDGVAALQIDHDYPGLVYRRIQQAVRALKARGVLLVLLSKNDADLVEAAFAGRPDMPLTLGDFSVVMANWREKHANLVDALSELNLGLESVVFLDDQPFEREQMAHALPAVRVLDAGSGPLDLLQAIHRCTDFDTLLVSREDTERARDYDHQRLRRASERDSSDRDAFLAGLEMTAEIAPVGASSLPRVVQMLGKTNQFNLTSRRHGQADVLAMMAQPGTMLRTLRLKDRFGDQGIVALAIAVPIDGDSLRLDSFLVSCRAVGRGVEDALWAELVRAARAAGYRHLNAEYVRSPRNGQVAGLLPRFGMVSVEATDAQGSYRMALDADVPPPSWIAVTRREAHEQL